MLHHPMPTPPNLDQLLATSLGYVPVPAAARRTGVLTQHLSERENESGRVALT